MYKIIDDEEMRNSNSPIGGQEEWDYHSVAGSFWNNLPLSKQMEYLEKYYPIGMTFHKIQPNHNDPDSKMYWEDSYCIIQGYKPTGKKSSWFILEVKNINNPWVIDECEDIHPGLVGGIIGIKNLMSY